MERKTKIIAPVQALRGIAALMVVWFHSAGQDPAMEAVFGHAAWGASGVDIFFLISGFIMVITTEDVRLSPVAFFSRRLVRIVPLYWSATLLIVACFLSQTIYKTAPVTPQTVVKSLLFIPYGPSPLTAWPLVIPGWTLNYEMFFYALFAVSLSLPQRLRLPALAALLIGLVVVGATLGPFTGPVLYTYTSPLLLEFLAGMVIAKLWRANMLTLNRVASAVALTVGVLLILRRDQDPPHLMLTQLAGASLVLVAALRPPVKAFTLPALLILGDASYSIYIIHMFIIAVLHGTWKHLHVSVATSPALFMAITVTASLVVGLAVYFLIEKPLTKRLHRFFFKAGDGPASGPGHEVPARAIASRDG